METSANLALPYIMPSQAQKHVTHNEAISMLDTLVQLSVLDRDLTAPPGGESDGDRYIVAAGATGDWAGMEDEVAVMQDGAWVFLVPKTGWVAWVADETQLCYWTGSAWETVASSITTLQNLSLLGIGTTADATNPFSAKLNKALWTAKTAGEGGDGDLRYTLNKETAADVDSLLFQTGFSGRAEIGLIGDDDLTFKVSPDGAAWKTPIVVNKDDGKLKIGGTTFNHAAVNVLGKALTGTANSYYGLCITNNLTDTTNKGGAVLVGAPYANANNPFMVLGPWATGTTHVVYYGGGGWGVPDATDHWFYSGTYTPGSPNTSTLAWRILPTSLVANRNLTPGIDNTYSLGASSLKWSVVYAATGTIDTSDERLKDVAGPVPLGLDFVRELAPVAYRWKVGGHDIETRMVDDPAGKEGVGLVAQDFPVPRPGGRTHYGLLAQQVKALLDARGVDFAGWTLADRDDPDSEQGLRYGQFVPILVKAVQELAAKVESLEALQS